MQIPWPVILFFIVYFALFVGLTAFLYRRKVKKSQARLPQDTKVMRSPGESLLLERTKIDEQLTNWIVAALTGPPVLAIIPFLLFYIKPQANPLPVLVSGVCLLSAGAIWGGRRIMSIFDRDRNYRLGIFGERIVADHLQPLWAADCTVVHDFPASANGKDFNLDHIVVGPSGIFVIETKTRRKKPGRPGREEHVVFFNGDRLDWPFGEDSKSVTQANANAQWLRDWLRSETNRDFPVRAIIAIPGWFVKYQPPKLQAATNWTLQVLNPKQVCGAIQNLATAPLPPADVKLIAHKLKAICCNVEY